MKNIFKKWQLLLNNNNDDDKDDNTNTINSNKKKKIISNSYLWIKIISEFFIENSWIFITGNNFLTIGE